MIGKSPSPARYKPPGMICVEGGAKTCRYSTTKAEDNPRIPWLEIQHYLDSTVMNIGLSLAELQSLLQPCGQRAQILLCPLHRCRCTANEPKPAYPLVRNTTLSCLA